MSPSVYLFTEITSLSSVGAVGVSCNEAMASDDDRRHLLDSDDSETSSSELRRRKSPAVRGVTDVVVDDPRLLSDDDLTAVGSYSNRLRTIGDNEYVVAVFVVAFDTKAGSNHCI